MAPKADIDGSGSRSITDFFNRAPALSQTWQQLDSSSSSAGGSDGELHQQTGNTERVALQEDTPQEPSMVRAPAATSAPASSDGNQVATSSMSSSLAFRDSPRTNRTVKFPTDSEHVTTQPRLIKATGQGSGTIRNGFSVASSSTSPLSSMRDAASSISVQSQAHSITRRVNVQGHEVVRASDEESDDSLEDLDELFAQRKPQYQAKRSLQPQRQTAGNVAKRPATVAGASPAAKETARDRMLKMRQNINAERVKQGRVAELNLKLQANTSAAEATTNNAKLEISIDLLKATSALNGDGEVNDEQIKKTMDAVNRIEALQQEIVWQFFRSDVPEHPMATFPSKALPKDPCMAPLKNQDKRDAAFKSGYVARLAKRQALPVETQYWMMDEICSDYESEELVVAYIKTLEVTCQRFTNHLKPENLRSLFSLVGAKDVAINLGKVEEELQIADSPPRAFSRNVRWLVELIRRLASTLHRDTAKLAIQLLARLAIDYSVTKDTTLRISIDKTLDALINSFDQNTSVNVLQEVACTLFNSIKHSALRSQLIEALPVTSPRAHFFRRHLALSFALDKTPSYAATFDNLALYSHVVLFLGNRSELRIRRSTDYTLITALIQLLDVAVDEGFARPETTPSVDSPALDGGKVQTDAKAEFFKPRQPQKLSMSSEEAAFNQNLDLLISVLEKLRDGIVTTGATHISRLEARSAIERLIQRLQFAVRTKRKERRDWFRDVAQVSSIPSVEREADNVVKDGDLQGQSVKHNSAIMDMDT